jgi:hypothetical protein
MIAGPRNMWYTKNTLYKKEQILTSSEKSAATPALLGDRDLTSDSSLFSSSLPQFASSRQGLPGSSLLFRGLYLATITL